MRQICRRQRNTWPDQVTRKRAAIVSVDRGMDEHSGLILREHRADDVIDAVLEPIISLWAGEAETADQDILQRQMKSFVSQTSPDGRFVIYPKDDIEGRIVAEYLHGHRGRGFDIRPTVDPNARQPPESFPADRPENHRFAAVPP